MLHCTYCSDKHRSIRTDHVLCERVRQAQRTRTHSTGRNRLWRRVGLYLTLIYLCSVLLSCLFYLVFLSSFILFLFLFIFSLLFLTSFLFFSSILLTLLLRVDIIIFIIIISILLSIRLIAPYSVLHDSIPCVRGWWCSICLAPLTVIKIHPSNFSTLLFSTLLYSTLLYSTLPYPTFLCLNNSLSTTRKPYQSPRERRTSSRGARRDPGTLHGICGRSGIKGLGPRVRRY